MRIQIELLDEPSSYKLQLLAVDKYIKENTTGISETKFLSTTVAETPTIKTTPKTNGVKVNLKETWRTFYVSCKKTKGGIYKFKIWNA